MRYSNTVRGKLVKRVNRFIAEVTVADVYRVAHVKNTGRLGELLLPGATVILEECDNPKRKTGCSLIGVYKEDRLVNIDSQAPNQAVFEALIAGGISEIGQVDGARREVRLGESRIDIGFRQNGCEGFIEVKGVTLESGETALFPDAPTTRGTRHLGELIKAAEAGYKCYVFFLIQMKGPRYFAPNHNTDPAFAAALLAASQAGVGILAYDANVYENSMIIGDKIMIRL